MTVITEERRLQRQPSVPPKESVEKKAEPVKTAPIAVKNISTKKVHEEILWTKAKTSCCKNDICLTIHRDNLPLDTVPTLDQDEAVQFIDECYSTNNKKDSTEHKNRIQQVVKNIANGYDYELTTHELEFGARMAWRNAPASLQRFDWRKLQVVDQRSVRTAEGMFMAICQHLKDSTNRGQIMPTVSVFPTDGCRLWNKKLLSYAAYRQDDGTVVGDADNLSLTQLCERLGWQGTGSAFDLLPIVLNEQNQDPVLFNLPTDLVLEVELTHPSFPWFKNFELKWTALTSRADQFLRVGGLRFNAAPLSHVNLASDVADQLLKHDADILQNIAEQLGFDTSVPATLWKEQAVVELNAAILFSFKSAGVSILNHHTASNNFINFYLEEQQLRGGCPGDWKVLVPSLSSSILLIYHQEMLTYNLTPAFTAGVDAWKTHKWQKIDGNRRATPLTFRSVANCVRWAVGPLMKRTSVTVLYASETGRSESFAEKLAKIFGRAFRVNMECMHDYDITQLGKREQLLLIVTSTFGNGGAPENGKKFFARMKQLCPSFDPNNNTEASLTNLKFAVFALGSRAYPDFCLFGHFCHDSLVSLGCKPILPISTADELKGQDRIFADWSRKIFPASCTSFDMEVGDQTIELDSEWKAETRRLHPLSQQAAVKDIYSALSKVHNRLVTPTQLLDRENLQAYHSKRKTLYVEFAQTHPSQRHEPGDHMAVFPSTPKSVVRALLQRLGLQKEGDSVFQVQKLVDGKWQPLNRLPTSSLTMAFTHFLDITSCPNQQLLDELCRFAQPEDAKRLQQLATDENEYETWKSDKFPSLVDVLKEFQSLKPDISFLLERVPILQPRLYSISSALAYKPKQIHLTAGVVASTNKDGSRQHSGLCSNFLNDLPIGSKLPCYVRQAADFHLPSDSKTPIMMVGAGTGLAPFRSFWQQRQAERDGKKTFGPLHLYFGCRHQAVDHIYLDEMQSLYQTGVMTSVDTAYSRLNTTYKTYVQHLLLRDCGKIWTHLQNEGHIYICGDALMASDVKSALVRIITTQGEMDSKEAQKYLSDMRETERLHEDIFVNVGKGRS